MMGVDTDLHMQTMVHQQHTFRCSGITAIADTLPGGCQTHGLAAIQSDLKFALEDAVSAHLRMGNPVIQGEKLIQKRASIGNHLAAPARVIPGLASEPRVINNDIGSIKRIIQTAPTRISGIQRITGVHHRHHQLWTRERCYLGVNVICGDCKVRRLCLQITNLLQKRSISRAVFRLPVAVLVPVIYLLLQAFALL